MTEQSTAGLCLRFCQCSLASRLFRARGLKIAVQ